MITRRGVLWGTALTVAGSALPRIGRAAAAPLRVASVKFGSLSWVLETIRAEGLDKKAGVEISVDRCGFEPGRSGRRFCPTAPTSSCPIGHGPCVSARSASR